MTVVAPVVEDSAHGGQSAEAAIKLAVANGNGHCSTAEAANGAAAPAPAGVCGPPPEEAPLQPGTDEYKLHLPVTEIHPHDVGTKDDWIPRWAPRRG
jgi:hypothetical protein